MENSSTASSMKDLRFWRTRTKMVKFRDSLGVGMTDLTDDGRMVLTYDRSPRTMTRNDHRDKEQESNVQTIAQALQTMEVSVSVGWLDPKKLEAADGQGIEKEINKFATQTGRVKLTAEKSKDWCNVCRPVFTPGSNTPPFHLLQIPPPPDLKRRRLTASVSTPRLVTPPSFGCDTCWMPGKSSCVNSEIAESFHICFWYSLGRLHNLGACPTISF